MRPVNIRKATTSDVGFAYAVAAARPERWLRVTHSGLPNPDAFWRTLVDRVEHLFVLEVGGSPIGLSSIFDVDKVAGVAWVDVVVIPGTDDSTSLASQAIVEFIRDNLCGVRRLFSREAVFVESPFATFSTQTCAAILRESLYHD